MLWLAWSYVLSGQCQRAAIKERITIPISRDTDFHETCSNITISKTKYFFTVWLKFGSKAFMEKWQTERKTSPPSFAL